MKFECGSSAAAALGCDLEELSTATFKHHLKHILAQVTARGRRLPPAEESPAGTGAAAVVLCLRVMGNRGAPCAGGGWRAAAGEEAPLCFAGSEVLSSVFVLL